MKSANAFLGPAIAAVTLSSVLGCATAEPEEGASTSDKLTGVDPTLAGEFRSLLEVVSRRSDAKPLLCTYQRAGGTEQVGIPYTITLEPAPWGGPDYSVDFKTDVVFPNPNPGGQPISGTNALLVSHNPGGHSSLAFAEGTYTYEVSGFAFIDSLELTGDSATGAATSVIFRKILPGAAVDYVTITCPILQSGH